MRARSLVSFAFVALLSSFLSWSSTARAAGDAANAVDAAAFKSNMHGLAAVLGQLLPDALDRRPVDDARAARIRQNAQALAGIAHHLSAMTARDLPDRDPTLGIVLGELSRAIADVERSKPDRLPQTALGLASTCIACHTRMPASDAAMAVDVDAALDADIQADIYAATRQFTKARAAAKRAVFDEAFAAKDPWRYERVLRRGLAIEVRVANDPAAALALVGRVVDNPNAEGLWETASAWKKDLAQWKSQQQASTTSTTFAAAAQLMNAAMQKKRVPGDSSAEVVYLRATSTLHQLLGDKSVALAPLQRAQALSWLGVAYEDLTDLDVWGLYLFYDAACVEAAPHTPLAQGCFDRYERAQLELWSGNGGAPLPPAIGEKVTALRALARATP
jgi:hypothetical protein